MNFAEKIKADFEAITGLTLLYGSRDGINWAISHNALPAGFFTLIRSSNVNADGLSIKESAEVAVSVIRLSPAEEPGYKTEEVIDECRQQVFAYLTALKSSGLMNLRSVTRASRIFDEFDDIICGFGVNIIVEEIDGTRCIPWAGPTLNITENGDYETLRYGQVHVDVQGGSPAVIEPLSVTPDYDPHTFTPSAGVDGFAPVEVAACPIPETDVLNVTPDNEPHQYLPEHGIGFSVVNVAACPACPVPDVRPLSVTPSRNAQTFSPSGFDGYAPVEVQGYTPVLQAKTATPATTAQVVTADGGYDGLSSVSVDAVTAAIDPNIQAGNIKKDVEILGVTGTMEQGVAIEGGTYTGQTIDPFWLMSGGAGGASLAQSQSAIRDNITEIDDDNITYLGSYGFGYCANLKVFRAHNATTWGTRWQQGSSAMEIIDTPKITTFTVIFITHSTNTIHTLILGTLTQCNSGGFYNSMTALRHLEIGTGTAVNLQFNRWTATDVIAEGQDAIDELNYNIKTYIADKVADRTGDSALTITFGASLYNVLTPATIAAFTAKNWSVASA